MATVLIAEDDGDTLDLLARLVEGLGHEPILASTGDKALDHCTPGLDLALLDYMMPGVDGDVVANELRMLGVPYLFISATNDDKAIARLVEMAPLGYIEKPFGLLGMRASIQTALQLAEQDPRNTLTRLINQAVGMMMERHRVGNREAYELLRNAARRSGLRVLSLAERMDGTHDLLYKHSAEAGIFFPRPRVGR